MADLKTSIEETPLLRNIGVIVFVFMSGFGTGIFIDDLIAKTNGKNILTDEQVNKLKKLPKTDTSQKIISIAEYRQLANRPQYCEEGTCSNSKAYNDKDCIAEKSPKEITEKFISRSEYVYNREEKNEKLLNDKYLGRWVCSPGWVVEIYD